MPPYLGVAGTAYLPLTFFSILMTLEGVSSVISNDTDFSSSKFPRGLSAFQKFEEPAIVTDRFAVNELEFFC